MTTVFAYLRVSGKSQVHGDGFRRQFIAIRKYCAAHNLRIVRIFKERGISGGTELEDRPKLAELFNALEENGTKTILIERLDRLARDLMVQETMIADFQKSGYALISTCEPDLCSTDPTRVLMRQIFGAIAQYDKAMIVLKLRGARQRKKARGERAEGRHAYGEKPGELEILNRMRRVYEGGLNPRQIADWLNQDRIPSRGGKPWHHATVAKILSRKLGPEIRDQGSEIREKQKPVILSA
jgi:DNA invertase Pin-like site-specific DNA recombinase